MTATVTEDRTDRAGSGESVGTGEARRRLPRIPDRIRRGGLPYLLLLPAVVLELLVHLIPMVMGIVMSFRQLTQFYVRNWGEAPWAAFDNYKVAVDFTPRSARPCSTPSTSPACSPSSRSACPGCSAWPRRS